MTEQVAWYIEPRIFGSRSARELFPFETVFRGKLNLVWYQQVPSLLTAIGLLPTFVALIIGISRLHADIAHSPTHVLVDRDAALTESPHRGTVHHDFREAATSLSFTPYPIKMSVCVSEIGGSAQNRLRACAPADTSTISLTRRPRRTLSHAQEKQRWRNGTVRSRFKRSGKKRKKNVRSGKVKKTTARQFLQEKILIWKDCSGGRSRPCISTEAGAGRTYGPRHFLLGRTDKPIVAKCSP